MSARERVVTRLARTLAQRDVAAVASVLSRRVRVRSDLSPSIATGRVDAVALLMEQVTGPLAVQSVNGAPGIVMRGTSGVTAVLCPVVRLGRVRDIWIVARPEHLLHFSTVTDPTPGRS